MINIGSGPQESSKFSITIQLRDKKGRLLNKTKTYHTDSAASLADFYERNAFKQRKKKHSDTKNLPKKEQADKLLAEAAQYAELKQQEVLK